MAHPVIATKLFVPVPRLGAVARPRLLERLRRTGGSRVTLVTAPAGFGKTTVLAQWLGDTSGEGPAVAWVSLEPADSDPASFWTYVVESLRAVVPDVRAGALELIASTPASIQLVLTDLVNELAGAPDDVWLVLDDYHAVEGGDLRDGMVFLLEHLPPQVHVVLATRSDPDLPLSRWRVRGELLEIRAGDLRFTPEEAATYLHDVAGLDLAPGAVAALEERTEGWIAALQLAALSLQGRADVAAFIAAFTGNDRYVVDYLVEEVLLAQPGPVREFLMRTSVLDRLTGPLCDALTGRGDGTHLLLALERANLFLVPLDDRREWYRYHHLFADVLRARLLTEQPELLPVLHERASHWYERQEMAEDAVRHALAARDVERAGHLMELAVPMIRRTRQDALFTGWLEALPPDAIRASPVLSVFYGWTLLGAGDLDAVESRFADAERALAAAPQGSASPWADVEELRTLPATIAVYRAALAQARGDADGMSAHAHAALDLAGPDDHLARAGAAGFLAFAAWTTGDVSSARVTFTQVIASLHAAGNLADELAGTVVLAQMELAAGRAGAARRLYRRALDVAEGQGGPDPRATGDLHVGLSEMDLDAGDLAGAGRHLQTAAVLDEHAGLVESRYRRFVAMSRLAQAQGDAQGAIALLDQAERSYVAGFFPDVRPIAAMRARIWIAQGELPLADEWARERGVSAADEVSYLREFDHLTLARLLLARHREHQLPEGLDEVLTLLDRLHDAARTSGRAGSLQEILVVKDLVRDALGQRPQSSSAEVLSERELQVLKLLDGELSGPAIARELFVSHNTLRTHTKHIFTKLDVTTRRAAVSRARERGLL